MLKASFRAYRTSLKAEVLVRTENDPGGNADFENPLKRAGAADLVCKVRYISLPTYVSTQSLSLRAHRTSRQLMDSSKNLMSTCQTRNGVPACINSNLPTRRMWQLSSTMSIKAVAETPEISFSSLLNANAIRRKVHLRVMLRLNPIPR